MVSKCHNSECPKPFAQGVSFKNWGFRRELVQKFTDQKWLIDAMTKFDQIQNVPKFLVKPIGLYLVTF